MRKVFTLLFLFVVNVSFAQVFIKNLDANMCFPNEFTFGYNKLEGETLFWDTDNDGFFDDGSGKEVKIFIQTDRYPIALKVIDDQGREDFIFQEFDFIQIPSVRLIERSNCTDRPSYFSFESLNNIDKSKLTTTWKLNQELIEVINNLYTINETGKHDVLLEVAHKGCKVSIDTVIEISLNPVASFESIEACAKDSFTVFSSSTSEEKIQHTHWSLIGYERDFDGEVYDLSVSEPGTYDVKLKVYTSDLCVDSITKPIEVLPIPSIQIYPSKKLTKYEGEGVEVEVQGDFVSFIWSDQLLDNPREFIVPGYKQFSVSNDYNCTVTDSIEILEEPLPSFEIVNNVVTPNGDNVNDYFKINLADHLSTIEISIYDREAKLLFESSSYRNDWAGESNGKQLPTGTYFYQVRFEDIFESGELTILNE